jgi:Glycosyltransferase family 29 (sialyltransferase)
VRDIDPAYSRLVSGKTVAVVGPARTLVGASRGQHIDSHDLVVRFNDTFDLPSRPELVADIGSRTDILYCNQVILRRALAGGVMWDRLAYLVCTNNSLSYSADGSPEPSCDHQDRPVIARLAAELARQGSTTRWRVVRTASEQLSHWLDGNWPRTGLVGIVDLLAFEPRRLFVTGMTFYHGGGHLLLPASHELHPLKNRDGSWARSPSGVGHDSYREIEVMRRLAQEHRGVLEVDDALQALLGQTRN